MVSCLICVNVTVLFINCVSSRLLMNGSPRINVRRMAQIRTKNRLYVAPVMLRSSTRPKVS